MKYDPYCIKNASRSDYEKYLDYLMGKMSDIMTDIHNGDFDKVIGE